MATFTGPKAKSGVQAKALHAGENVIYGTYSASATLSAGDVIQMVKVPDGARVTGITVSGNLDLSTVPAAVINVGDGIDDDRYFSGVLSEPSAVNTMFHGGHGYEYSAADTIDVTVDGIGGSANASSVLKMTVRYVLDDIDQSQF